MNKYSWNWYSDEPFWCEGGETIEDCIKQARELNDADYESVAIGENVPFDVAGYLHIETLLEGLEEDAYDFAGEAAEDWRTFDTKKPEEIVELRDAIAPIIVEWLKKHGRYPTFYQVTNIAEYSLYEDNEDETNDVKSCAVCGALYIGMRCPNCGGQDVEEEAI